MGESTGGGGNEAGSDNVDRSNPNEMRAREQAAVRAGTVTDSSGRPVTSTNRDGTQSVVTSGNDFERSMAQQQFAAQTGNPLSRSAQNLAAEVARKEQAAVERAADAGRLAGAPAGAALANIGQPPAALGLDDELAFTQGMSGGAPRIGDITQPAGTGFTDPETARIANLTPDQAAAENITVSRQRAAQAAMQGRTVNPVTGALQGPDLIDIFSETDLDPAAGQEAQRARAQQEMDLRAQALSAIQNNLGIASASQATAANVLGTSPSDMMLVGQQNMPANVTQSAIDRAQFPNAFSPDVDSFAVNAPGGGMMSVPVNQTPINQSNLSPMQLLAAQQNIFGDDYQPTAASVLGTSPADMARMATADAGMITDQSPSAGIGSLPTPGGTVRDLQAQRQQQAAAQNFMTTGQAGAAGPPQLVDRSAGPSNIDFTLNFPGQELDRTITGSAAGTGITTADAMDSALAFGFDGANQARVPVTDASSLENLQTTAPVVSAAPVVSGPLPDMIDAETDIFARDLTDPNRPGYRDGLPIGLETYTRPDGVTVTRNLAGLTEAQRENLPFSMRAADLMGSQPYGYELDNQGNVIGQVGTPGMGILGNAVTGLQNMIMGPPETVEDLLDRGVYTGMSLSGSDSGGGGGGEQIATKAPTDPCPAGYQLVDGVCQPVDDELLAPPPQDSDFIINPTTGLPTLFTPATQATQVGQINPFVLQPYAPQQIAAPTQGIQGLSPTGAALGRQV